MRERRRGRGGGGGGVGGGGRGRGGEVGVETRGGVGCGVLFSSIP